MEAIDFEITEHDLNNLKKRFPKDGKNSDIGKIAVEVIKMYFLSLDSKTMFEEHIASGSDITVISKGIKTNFEIKGTEDSKISFTKLKVSSRNSYNALVDGMLLLRITNIGNTKMKIYKLKYGVDFELVEEARWAIKRKK